MPLRVILTATEVLALLPIACRGEVRRLHLDLPPTLDALTDSERVASIKGLIARKLVAERGGTFHLAPVVQSSLAAICSPQRTLTLVQREAGMPRLARTVNLLDGIVSINYLNSDGAYHLILATAEAGSILSQLDPLLKEPPRGSSWTPTTATASLAELDQAADSFAAIEDAFCEAGLGWPTDLRKCVATMVTAARFTRGAAESDNLTMLREGDTVWLFQVAHGTTEIEMARTGEAEAYQIVRDLLERYL